MISGMGYWNSQPADEQCIEPCGERPTQNRNGVPPCHPGKGKQCAHHDLLSNHLVFTDDANTREIKNEARVWFVLSDGHVDIGHADKTAPSAELFHIAETQRQHLQALSLRNTSTAFMIDRNTEKEQELVILMSCKKDDTAREMESQCTLRPTIKTEMVLGFM